MEGLIGPIVKKFWFSGFILLLVSNQLFAQEVSGVVMDLDGNTLVGANVIWLASKTGTHTDEAGAFSLRMDPKSTGRELVISYVGFIPDTLSIGEYHQNLFFRLAQNTTLDAVTVSGDRPGSFSANTPARVEVLTELELKKGACCDLAGCFNTQASVDPNTTNVLTNAKELRILGLSGIYNQLLIEGFPMLYGLAYTYGVSAIPGPLIDNIYISKGSNSVLQGFENISGQINVELKEPETAEPFFLNLYGNSFGESQVNAYFSGKVGKAAALLALHTTQPGYRSDSDDDTFLDYPLTRRYSLINKWTLAMEKDRGWFSKAGIRLLDEHRLGGMEEFQGNAQAGSSEVYGQLADLQQADFYTKTGYRFSPKFGLTGFLAAQWHGQESWFGQRHFDAWQTNLYGNLQLEREWGTGHQLKSGLSYRQIEREEVLSFSENPLDWTFDGTYRTLEQVAGLFAENTFYFLEDRLTLIGAFRLDHHQRFGWQALPRALTKISLFDLTDFRLSAGKGWRLPSVFTDYPNILAGNRDIRFAGELRPEEAWNYGMNFSHTIPGNRFTASLSLDYYRTEIFDQVFPDYYLDPAEIWIGNRSTRTISNAFQVESVFRYDEVFEWKLAYNFLDVFQNINGEKEIIPFNSIHKVKSSFSLKSRSGSWQADANLHWIGRQRLPGTSGNPPEFQMDEWSDDYFLVNLQYSRFWKRFECYVGLENLLDFRNDFPILGWGDPFGPYFDTATAWGPVRGLEGYLGVRFRIGQ